MRRLVAWLIISGVVLGAVTAGIAMAVEPADDGNLVKRTAELRQHLEARIAELSADRGKLAEAMQKGYDRTVLCRHCHGEDGIAIQREGLQRIVPNLAGQNPVYIVDQFQRFEDGRRKDFMMGGLAVNFTEEDMINTAIYYSMLEPEVSGGGRPDIRPKGKRIFDDICAACHGKDGKGQEGYAMIAGQRDDYIVQMLKTFRDDRVRRVNPWMTGVAVGLTDEDMEAVASYVANLQ